jgi:hypothetical protein
MRYLCDRSRHLICQPYTLDGLHAMAAALGIKRCWFHAGLRAHYDIPKSRVAEITARCTVVTSREIVRIIAPTLSPMESQLWPEEARA